MLRLTGAFDELKKQNPNTRQLNEWFRNNCRSLGIEIDVYFEQYPTYGQLVVDADSANPNVEGITPVPVPEDHLSICKPAGPDEDIHVSLIAFIERTLKKNETDASRGYMNGSLRFPGACFFIFWTTMSFASLAFTRNSRVI